MRLSNRIFFIILIGLAPSCAQQIPIDDIINQPNFKESDQVYQDVYKTLDGTWEGTFYIYQDTSDREKIEVEQLNFPQKIMLRELPLKLTDTIIVKQVYKSYSPYFQTVTITDYYPAQDKYVTSKGVNKIQDGKMWCVVHKPDETIIHEGALDGEETIIWQRDISDPQSKEYFRETVTEETYDIVGWGYYGDSDTARMPPYWFYGQYTKK